MKTYEIQVEVEVVKKCGCRTEKAWTSIRPSNSSQPYRFGTKEEAIRMAEMCYGATGIDYKIV